MAMLNSSTRIPSPPWVRLEVFAEASSMTTGLGIAFKCKDGYATVVATDLDLYPSFAKQGTLATSKADILRKIMEHVVKQLATLELETE